MKMHGPTVTYALGMCVSVCVCSPLGRPHSKSWTLKVVGQMWADKCAQDVADPIQNAGKTVSRFAHVL